MSAAVASPPRVALDDCIVLRHVSWATYESLLADDEGRSVPRIVYDRGVMELVTPSKAHELDSKTIVRFVDVVSAVLDIPVQSTGATTFRRPDLERGFEADGSFYVQNEARVRTRREADLSVDPPPDVVLEMEMSRSAIDKLRLFASIGIPEVWRCDGERVTIYLREGEGYREAPASAALPALTSEVLTRFLALSRTMPSPEWFRLVSEWARDRRQERH
jgi:Uma2 family endonuclease